MLAVAVQLLLADRELLISWLRPPADHLPGPIRPFATGKGWPGIYPLLAFILVALAAHPVYLRLRWLGWLVLPLAVVAALLIVIDVPKSLSHAGAVPVGGWAQVLAAGFLAVLLAKFALLHRYASRAYTRVPEKPLPLLPSQEENARELIALITESAADRVLPIEGRLGEGKSFLVHWLRRAWEDDRSKPVIVIVDVWQQQTESDLQGAILESLYSHPAYLERLNWLQIPASFLIARWIAAVHNLRSSIELKVRDNKAAFELDLNIPRLRWQSHFERVTSRVTRSGRGTVVVLDEIDRAAPLVAQAALTLARRSVDVPGVTVVIPYIRSLIRFKAFNPLLSTLPDLGSAMDAILYEERFGALSNSALGNPDDSILSTWTALWDSDGETGTGLLSSAPYASDRSLTDALRLGVFATAPRPFRDRMQERFEEKYLGAAALQLHPPKPEDLAAMVVTFEGLSRKVSRLALRTGEAISPVASCTTRRYWVPGISFVTGARPSPVRLVRSLRDRPATLA